MINIRLKYFPIVFSQNKFLHQFLDIKLVQNGFVHMAQRNIIQAHLATSFIVAKCVRLCTISIFVWSSLLH